MRSVVADLSSQPIRNLFSRPSLEVGSSTRWGFNPLTSSPTLDVPMTGGFSGSSYRRAVIGTAGSWVNIGHFVGAGGGRAQMYEGHVYTYSIYVRSSVAANMRASVETYDSASGGTRLASQFGSTVTLVPNVWTRIFITFTATANAWGLLSAYTQSPGVAFAVGDTLDADAAMATEGPTLWPYADGDTPGWLWAGTSRDSESVGHPYVLESIGGFPGLTIVPPATGSLTGPAFQGKTMYFVYDISETATNFGNTITWGAAGTGRLIIQTSASGTPDMRVAWQPIGIASQVLIVPGVRTMGRHVGAITLNDAVTVGRAVIDNAAFVESTFSPGSGMTGGSVVYQTASSLALLYNQYHNDETMKRVMAWLARKYGAPIPTGY